MRLDYCDEERFPNHFALWEANCRRSLQGKAGQRELREMEAALLALPAKRLVQGVLLSDDGDVCALGAYGRYKGLDLTSFETCDKEITGVEVGIAGGMPRLVAWAVVDRNDRLDGQYQVGTFVLLTPEERYDQMLAWVRAQLKDAAA